jgi:hypothetical protein
VNPFQLEANLIMRSSRFSSPKRWCALVWAARWRACSTCGVGAWGRCVNVSRGKNRGTPIKGPHSARVDYKKLVEALRERGYR